MTSKVDGYAKNQTELALALGVALGTITTWKGRGAPIVRVPGKGYEIEPVREWREKFVTRGRPRKPRTPEEEELERARAAVRETKLELDTAPWTSGRDEDAQAITESRHDVELRLKRAQAEEREHKAKLAKLEVEQAKARLMPITQVRERDQARIALVSRELLAWGRRLGPDLEGLSAREITAKVDMRVRELLNRFAEM